MPQAIPSNLPQRISGFPCRCNELHQRALGVGGQLRSGSSAGWVSERIPRRSNSVTRLHEGAAAYLNPRGVSYTCHRGRVRSGRQNFWQSLDVVLLVFDAVFFWQFSPYSKRGGLYPSVYPPWWSLPVLAFAAGFVLTLGRTHHRLLVPVALVGGFCFANACLIVADCWNNQANHNLWPFEFVGIAVLTAPAFLGMALKALLQRRRQQ